MECKVVQEHFLAESHMNIDYCFSHNNSKSRYEFCKITNFLH
jgi:hypothetical protein